MGITLFRAEVNNLIIVEHAKQYSTGHTAVEYKQRVNQCPMVFQFDGTGVFNSSRKNGWSRFYEHFFAEHPLYVPITLGFQGGDYSGETWPCFSQSTFVLMKQQSAFFTKDDMELPKIYQILPWETRDPIPVWRGTLWGRYPKHTENHKNVSQILTQYPSARMKVVLMSLRNPQSINARLSGIRYSQPMWGIWRNNATNGLHEFSSSFNRINDKEYYQTFQTSLVLKGIGAAFRLTRTLHSQTAVIIEDADVTLWYHRFMVPYTHYIPLARHAKNLTAVLEWVQEHPSAVKHIAYTSWLFALTELNIHYNIHYMASHIIETFY